MSTTAHTRSVHIDAPVAKVFDYVKDPHNFFSAFTAEEAFSRIAGRVKAELTDVSMAADAGLGTTYSFRSGLFVFHVDATLTREEFIPNERIMDRNADAAVAWTFTFEPDQTGTTMSLTCAFSSRVPLLDKVEDVVYWDGDRDLDTVLSRFKSAIET